MVQSDRGKQDMDAIRDQVSAMEREEIDLRARRLAEMADAYSRAIFSGIISSLLGIGLTGVIGFLIFRAEAARRKEDWLQAGRVRHFKAMLGHVDHRIAHYNFQGIIEHERRRARPQARQKVATNRKPMTSNWACLVRLGLSQEKDGDQRDQARPTGPLIKKHQRQV